MSNLTIVKSKNQIGVGTNQIQLTNSQSSALNIKKNDDSYSFLEFNTSSNTIGIGTKMETNALITFKGTTKITTLSKGDLVYLDSTGNWTGVGPVDIGSYIKVNSSGTGLQWTNEAPLISILSTSPLHIGTLSSNSDNIIITFDDIVVAGTGNIVLTPSSGPVITIDVTNTSLVSFSSNICTINPNSNLDSGGLTYTLTMNSGVIKNSNGVLFSGILSPTYQFNSKDTTTPIFTNLSPGTNTYINNTNIGYTLSESFASGTVTFTSTGGTTDSSSPHIQVLSGSELNAGTRNIGVLTDAPTLVNGTVYSIAFNGIDLAENSASQVSVTNITYDTTAPTASITSHISTYTNDTTPNFTFTTNETGTLTTNISQGFSSNSTISSTGSHTITFNTLPEAEYSGKTITLTDAAGNTTTMNLNTFTVDTTAPVLSSVSSIGTTTDTTPNLTFSTTEIGTLTTSISQGFSSGSTVSITSIGSNTITFATLSNATYSGKTITLTDGVGNVSNTLTIPTFIIAANPYGTTDIRYHMWNQNMQTGSETRGHVGYVNISCMIQGTAFYVVSLGSKWLYFTTNPPHSALSSWNANFSDGNGRYDEHTFKIVYNSGSNNYTITPDSSSWSSSTGNPFKHDMRAYIQANGSTGSNYVDYHSNPAVQMTHISGTSSQSSTWSVYNAAAGSTYKIAYGQKLHYKYTTGRGYGYVAVLAPSPPKSDYVQSMSTYSSEQTIFKFI